MDIKKIYSNIDDLTAQLEEMTAQLKEAVKMAVKDTGKEKNPYSIQRISENAFIIKKSQLIGRPWNPSFYDWEKTAEIVLDYLAGKPCTQWKSILQSKLEKADTIVEFEKVTSVNGYRYTNKIPVDKLFIEKIIEKI